MVEHLLLRLEAPLLSLGAPAVDQRRPMQRWPATSLLTGLLGNALGWRRTDPQLLDRLQARLRWAARVDRPGQPVTDFQTVQLAAGDQGWTTRGVVEERAGGANTYDSPHIRWRDYRADASLAVAVRLDPAEESPTLVDLAQALQHPVRPLFIGRKNCLPSQRMLIGMVLAADTLAALAQAVMADDAVEQPALFVRDALVPKPAAGNGHWLAHRSSDERRFAHDVHAGLQTIHEHVPAAAQGHCA